MKNKPGICERIMGGSGMSRSRFFLPEKAAFFRLAKNNEKSIVLNPRVFATGSRGSSSARAFQHTRKEWLP
jgi:hypothetical protein